MCGKDDEVRPGQRRAAGTASCCPEGIVRPSCRDGARRGRWQTAKPRWQKWQASELLYGFGGRFAHRAETSPAFVQVDGAADAIPYFASQENRIKANKVQISAGVRSYAKGNMPLPKTEPY